MLDVTNDKQWKTRAVAAELVAQAVEVLVSGAVSEHEAISALEDAIKTRRLAHGSLAAND